MANRPAVRTFIAIPLILAGLSFGCDDPPDLPNKPLGQPGGSFSISSIAPNAGPTDRAISVSIHGTGFEPGATVTFDGAPVSATVVNSTLITLSTVFHPPGPVNVVVTNPSGKSVTLPGGFTYVIFGVTSISPTSGFTGPVTVFGTGFLAGATLKMGGVSATGVNVTSTRLSAMIPLHPAGAVDVMVTNPAGYSATLSSGFTYLPVIVTASASSVTVGSAISASWTAPNGRTSLDWIGLFRVGMANIDYLQYSYTNAAASGTWTISAPTPPGQYEFRYLPEDGYVDVARSTVFTVTAETDRAPVIRPLFFAPQRSDMRR